MCHPPPTAPVGGGGPPVPPVGGGGVSVRSIFTGAGSAPGETSIESFGAGWPAGWLCQMGLVLARERQIILNVVAALKMHANKYTKGASDGRVYNSACRIFSFALTLAPPK